MYTDMCIYISLSLYIYIYIHIYIYIYTYVYRGRRGKRGTSLFACSTWGSGYDFANYISLFLC